MSKPHIIDKLVLWNYPLSPPFVLFLDTYRFWGFQSSITQAIFNLRKVKMSKFLRSRSRKSRRGSEDNQLAAEEGGSPAKDRWKKLNGALFSKSLIFLWQGLIWNGLIRIKNCCCRDKDYGSITSLVNNEVIKSWIAYFQSSSLIKTFFLVNW